MQTDVIVNSVGTDLKFGVGALCRALLEKAGPALQVEFDEEKQRQAAGQGHVLCTSGCALACQSVLHAILPMWDGGKGQALKVPFDYYFFKIYFEKTWHAILKFQDLEKLV